MKIEYHGFTPLTVSEINNAHVALGPHFIMSNRKIGHTANYVTLSNLTIDAPIAAETMAAISGAPGYFANASYGQGSSYLAINYINDAGTITALQTDVSGNGNQAMNFEVYQPSGYVYASMYNQNDISRIDVSPAWTGGTSFSEILISDSTRYGAAHINSFKIVGDYLYMGKVNSTATQKRLHIPTNVAEELTVINIRNNAANSSYAGYDQENDRVFYNSRSAGEVWMTDNASQPTGQAGGNARTFCLRLGSAGATYQTTTSIFGLVYHVSGDVYYLGGYRDVNKYDIGPCLDTGNPGNPIYLTGKDYWYTPLQEIFPFFSYINKTEYPDYIWMTPDRSFARMACWVDLENYEIVGPYVTQRTRTELYKSDVVPLQHSYGLNNIDVTTTGGIQYHILGGYGSEDGYKFYAYTGLNPFYLEPSGHVTFGPYSLEDGTNVSAVNISNYASFGTTPSGTSMVITATNNSGQSWESINNPADNYYFDSIGSTVYIRFDMSGAYNKTPYCSSRLCGTAGINLISDVPKRRTLKRLRGAQ